MDLLPPVVLNPTTLPQGFSDSKCHYYTDMKSDVVMVAIGDFTFMFLCLDMVLYIEGHF